MPFHLKDCDGNQTCMNAFMSIKGMLELSSELECMAGFTFTAQLNEFQVLTVFYF